MDHFSPCAAPEEFLHKARDPALGLLEGVVAALAGPADHIFHARAVPVDVLERMVVRRRVKRHAGGLEERLEVLELGGRAVLSDGVDRVMPGDDDPGGFAGGQLGGQPRALLGVRAVAVLADERGRVEHDECDAHATYVLGHGIVQRWEVPARGAAGVVDLGLDC